MSLWATAIPSVRRECERLVEEFNGTLIRINVREAQGPEGTISLATGALLIQALCGAQPASASRRASTRTRSFFTLPEATPVHEAATLQEDLRRAQIEPFAWIINQSFCQSGSDDPLLQLRGQNELPYLHEVVNKLSQRTVIVPWLAKDPVGSEGLRQFFNPAVAS